jgi:hypothetical protein
MGDVPQEGNLVIFDDSGRERDGPKPEVGDLVTFNNRNISPPDRGVVLKVFRENERVVLGECDFKLEFPGCMPPHRRFGLLVEVGGDVVFISGGWCVVSRFKEVVED